MASKSNGRFLPLLPSPPLPDAGWTVEVIAHNALLAYALGRNPKPLAKITKWREMTWSPAISDAGAGSITLALADPVFAYALADGRTPDSLWRYENLWVIYEDGQWRGEFFGTPKNVQHSDAGEAAARTVTISGAGNADCLRWASVFSPYYPATTPKGKTGVYQYKNVPVMASYRALLAAAQKRGVIPQVQMRFTNTADSAGVKWEDTPAKRPANTATQTIGGILFGYDSSALTAAGITAVKAMAAKIAKVTYPVVTVTGHASSDGSKAHNYQKALDRANTVRNAILAERAGITITVVSKGETQPIASNATAAGRAKNRRVVVTYQSAPAYTDTVYTPERGVNLYELLQQLTSGQTTAQNRGPIHCEWLMGKQFNLQVRTRIGIDRSKQVIYHDGDTCTQARADTYSRAEIANVIAVQNQQTVYQVATDPASITKWGRREMFTLLEGTYAAGIHAKIAATQRQAYADETRSMTIKVTAGPYRTPFRDYGLGDYIGVWRTRGKLVGAIAKERVMAITVRVDEQGRASYELTLNALRTTRAAWLQLQINALISRKRGIRAVIADDEPRGLLPGDFWTPPPAVTG